MDSAHVLFESRGTPCYAPILLLNLEHEIGVVSNHQKQHQFRNYQSHSPKKSSSSSVCLKFSPNNGASSHHWPTICSHQNPSSDAPNNTISIKLLDTAGRYQIWQGAFLGLYLHVFSAQVVSFFNFSSQGWLSQKIYGHYSSPMIYVLANTFHLHNMI